MLEHERNPVMRDLERDCAQSIAGGQTFSEVLEQYPDAFDAFYLTMVRSGESQGTLDTVLEELTSMLQNQQTTKRRLVGAAVYPTAMAVLLVGGFMAWAFKTWSVAHAPGPLSILAGLGLLSLAGLLLLARTRYGRRLMDRWKFEVPLVGALTHRLIVAKCIRTLGCLLARELPVLQAIRVVQRTSGNVVVSEALGALHESVKEGESLTVMLEPLGFGPTPLSAGKESSDDPQSLPNRLLRFAEDMEEQVHDALTSLHAVAGPIFSVLLMVFVAILVAILWNF